MLQRNKAEMGLRLVEERNKLAALPYERVHALTCCIRDINRSRNDKEDSTFLITFNFQYYKILEWRQLFFSPGEKEHGEIVDKLLALESRVDHWIKEITKVDVWHSSAKYVLLYIIVRLHTYF